MNSFPRGVRTHETNCFPTFENRARAALTSLLGVFAEPGALPNVPKKFDFLARDGAIAGDAKYFNMVRGTRPPPAKYSAIA
jgi:hypothetical protein